MAESRSQTDIQPCLLDRLRDDEPDRTVEAVEKRVLSQGQIRESVRRDLSWLLNAVSLDAVEDLGAYPEVARSVLNYGLPDLAGSTLSNLDTTALERRLREIIWLYEPRLLKNTLRITLVQSREHRGRNSVCFRIDAELFAEPYPIRLALRTDIDLEDGRATVADFSGEEAR